MSESKTPWTPGPYASEGPDMFGDYNIVLADNEEDRLAIAAVVSNLRDPDEVAANARLIACAPEMAEALQLWAHYDRGTEVSGVELMLNYNRALEATKAVLAKIGGQS